MTNIIVNLCKRKGVQIETVHVAKHYAKDACIKVIEWRSTTEEATVLGVLRVCQLALFLVTRIG
jgi:hypothetical protein